MMDYQITISVPKIYKPLEIHFIDKNGCCEKNYFVVTANRRLNGDINYSCQCGCGGWCTSGHNNKENAINEYKSMCSRRTKK